MGGTLAAVRGAIAGSVSTTDTKDFCAGTDPGADIYGTNPEPLKFAKATATGETTVQPTTGSTCYPDNDWFDDDDAESLECNLEQVGTGVDLLTFSGPSAQGDGTEGGVIISGSSELCYEPDFLFDDVMASNNSFYIFSWIM